MCHYGNRACPDQSDRAHECRPPQRATNADGKAACDACGSFAWRSKIEGGDCDQCSAILRLIPRVRFTLR